MTPTGAATTSAGSNSTARSPRPPTAATRTSSSPKPNGPRSSNTSTTRTSPPSRNSRRRTRSSNRCPTSSSSPGRTAPEKPQPHGRFCAPSAYRNSSTPTSSRLSSRPARPTASPLKRVALRCDGCTPLPKPARTSPSKRRSRDGRSRRGSGHCRKIEATGSTSFHLAAHRRAVHRARRPAIHDGRPFHPTRRHPAAPCARAAQLL
jgi:hypothetical protein